MKFLRTQLHNSSGRVEAGCVSSIGHLRPSHRLSCEVRVLRALSTARNAHLRTSTPPRSQHPRCIGLHVSGRFLDNTQARYQSTATAVEQSASNDDVGGKEAEELNTHVVDGDISTATAADGPMLSAGMMRMEDGETLYTGLFDEMVPTPAGKKALRSAQTVSHQELLNLTSFCDGIRKRLAEPGSIVQFSFFPVWDALLPVLAEQLGLHYVVIKRSHPYFKWEADWQGSPLRLLVRPKERLPTPEDTSQPLQNILLDRISADHIQHWLSEFRGYREFRGLREVPHSYLMKLMIMACRYDQSAVPILEFTQNDHSLTTEPASTEPAERSYRLKLSNERFGISITRDVDPTTPKESLGHAIMDYTESICKVIPSITSENFRIPRSHWDPSGFLGRGVKALDWGGFSFEDTQVGHPSTLDLWKVQLRTTKHGPLGPAILWNTKKFARRMASFHAFDLLKHHLQAAYASGKLTPDEYRDFALYWGEQVPGSEDTNRVSLSQISQRPMSHEIRVNEELVFTMVEALRSLVKSGFQSTYEWTSIRSADLELVSKRRRRSLSRYARLDDILYGHYQKRKLSDTTQSPNLPVRENRICSEIYRTIENSDITIITAATGSGKTTQIPQIIFDEYIAVKDGSVCNIVCTQPRRVSAISVANRVAFERSQYLGLEVGYKVRFDARPVRSNRGITYMTSGYLLRLLESDPLEILQTHSHIILDEVHARDVDTDLLLTALKNILDKRVMVNVPKMPKIILMSATINAEFFKSYFEALEPRIKVSTIDVPGRMYDVQERRLDQVLMELRESHPRELDVILEDPEIRNYVDEQMQVTTNTETEINDVEPMAEAQETNAKLDEVQAAPKDLLVPTSLVHLLIVQLLSTTESGDILVFLPGLAEIEALERLLLNSPLTQSDFSNSDNHRIFKLHSALYETNYDVFEPVPSGCRRVILATNIAETSITLADVKVVVDTGLSRQATFDQVTQSGTFGLQWISRAEATQRRGRAGRTHVGVYYGTYSQARYDTMAIAPTPEILKTSLDQLVLRNAASEAFRLLDNDPGEDDGGDQLLAGQALLTAPSPPEKRFVAAASQQLFNIRALTAEGNTTPMGRVLSILPMKPAAGKAVLLGLIFRCLDPLLVYGALREDLPIMFDPIATGALAERRRTLTGPNDDDKWADSQAFFLYDSLRRQQNNDAAIKLRESLSLRHDAYCEYAHTSGQAFEKLEPLLGLPKNDNSLWAEPKGFTPLFPNTPRLLNTNSANVNLVKALAISTLGTRFACWSHKHWRTQNHPRVLPHPKSVNHAGGRRAVLQHRLRRESGDLLSYGTMRVMLKDKYPWVYETATATPLMGILFAESVALVEEESTFVINGWLKYRLTSEVKGKGLAKRTAKIIWEYRKALDRFLAHAMQMISLEPHNLKKVRNGELSADEFNMFLGAKDNKFRKIIVDSVVQILGIDAKDHADRVEARRLDEQGGEEQANVSANEANQNQQVQQILAEAGHVEQNDAEAEAESENDAEEEGEEKEEEEMEYTLRMVGRRGSQKTFSPIAAAAKKRKEDERVQKYLRGMVKDVLSERWEGEKKMVDEL